MGKHKQSWQKSDSVLVLFADKEGPDRRGYKAFVVKGIDQGRRDDLIGGGLIRSAGGWAAVNAMRKAEIHEKSDERILGDGDFAGWILSKGKESLDRRYALKARGVDVDYIVERVAGI